MDKKVIILVLAFVVIGIAVFLFKPKAKTTQTAAASATPDAPATPAAPAAPAAPIEPIEPTCSGLFVKYKKDRYREDRMNWGEYATAVKIYILNTTPDDDTSYNEISDNVLAWFKEFDIEPKGQFVREFAPQIKEFVRTNRASNPANTVLGASRCDTLLFA
jgi:hypothetical protein